MEPFFNDYCERLDALHQGIQTTLSDLPDEALDWVAGEEMNSLAVLATHVAGAERYWVCAVAGDESSERVRAEEFKIEGDDADTLLRRLDDALSASKQVLSRLKSEELDAMRHPPGQTNSYSVAWALMHALDHTAEHLGHMQMIRQLWEHEQKKTIA